MQPDTAEPAPRSGPIPGILGRLASRAYAAAIARRNRAFDAGRGVESLPLPVISVGNLSVGGTGKTPMVAHLCRVLLERGARPCIAMRGYSRGGRAGVAADSDEADVYLREFGDLVDIVAQPDRAAGVRALLASASNKPDVIVLDDGFQHRRIRRDLDIVLIDASRDAFADRLLPAGWLREPTVSLRRASCVVLTHTELATPQALTRLRGNITASHGRPPIAATRHLWTALRDAQDHALPLDWLLSRRILGVCAIGNPRGFTDALKATLGPLAPAELITLPDHDPYSAGTVLRITDAAVRTGAGAIVVTDKDWSKLRRLPASTWPCPIVRPVLALAFLDGKAELEQAVLACVPSAPAR
jgi:tetraacyldisaccharide 4'-kinase